MDEKSVLALDAPGADLLKTIVFVSNIHCATCTSLIAATLANLSPTPISHSASILSNCVKVIHHPSLSPQTIVDALHLAGFDIEACYSGPSPGDEETDEARPRRSLYLLEGLGARVLRRIESRDPNRQHHDEVCGLCRSRKLASADSSPNASTLAFATSPYKSSFGDDAPALSPTTSGAGSTGLGLNRFASDLDAVVVDKPQYGRWLAILSIRGMTCSACVNSIRSNLLDKHAFIEKAEISALTHSGSIVFSGDRDKIDTITESIEDTGFDVEVVELEPFDEGKQFDSRERTLTLHFDGLHCSNCPPRINEAIQKFASSQITVVKPLYSTSLPEVTIKYTPQPDITVRTLIKTIEGIDPALKVTVKPAQTLEDRSALVHKAEVRRLAVRFALCVICAIPTFIIGIVFMALLPADNKYRVWSEREIWKGNVTIAEWSLLIISTPVYFFAADLFHVRALSELRGLWSRKNPRPVWKRFLKFGSMNLLMSLGTTIAYFSSIALLAISASQTRDENMGHNMPKSEIAHATYFDAVVFLTMFLLFGRLLESYSKAKSANAVSLLGNLRPKEAKLIVDESSTKTETVSVELLEVGDRVIVPHGQSPPLDGSIVSGDGQFDESALTGESRLVSKAVGDDVFAGTVNQGRPVTVEIKSISGRSMLDNIVRIVREGQVQRAPIERVADLVTGYFVPVISYLAVLTWLIWLCLGYTGALPQQWMEGNQGGWALWSMSFAIAVFVIACPCGIGLAAPTALFIGTGLAARYGILAKGGGEAFQEASWLDAIVFDKTGTLTMGGEPEVVDAVIAGDDGEKSDWHRLVLGLVDSLENASGHPLARALVKHAQSNLCTAVESTNIEEVPGRGVTGTFTTSSGEQVEAYIGNEAFMQEKGVTIDNDVRMRLDVWKTEAKSVVVLAAHRIDAASTHPDSKFKDEPTILAYLSIADQIRPEASYVISELDKLGINVYMITGDNAITAMAVARSVGIPAANIIAGVLPHQKAEQITYLQKTAAPRRRSAFSTFFHRHRDSANARPRVAMVGDGINDSPALVSADVGIAIGSGADIALSSASFILLREDLRQVLLLLNLAAAVIRRVKFNFFWAGVYNAIGVPIAAGALYAYRRTRLDPSWAALAMAMSSVSVVASSLLLRSRLWGVGFRVRKEWREAA
ncbi:hypothetical protein TWF696_001253 [Orbilia brochopaga]|uniref:HMA domain-containing protein n=1 Tax=Orbilia brochopaga TaxID=3140254 RepID=A0AAV9UCJ6_9PEZI